MKKTRPRTSSRKASRVHAVAVALLAVAVTTASTVAPASGETVTPGGFRFLAAHPGASAQPTAVGRVLTELRVHEGAVWAGYGDYGANTGPIAVSSFDPNAPGEGFQQSHLSDTEAVYNLREVNGQLIAPATDPRTRADFAIDGPWRDNRSLGATHVYDTSTLDGNDLWMVGSHGADAVAWRSLDGGGTWIEVLRVAPRRNTDTARFYFAGVMDGSMMVQATDYKAGPHAHALGFDGISWTERTSILQRDDRGWRTDSFGGGLVYHSSGHGWQGAVRHHDGHNTVTLHDDAYDVEVTSNHVWILTATGSVVRSADLIRWVTVAQAPQSARSLAVDGDDIYVGTTTSELWAMTMKADIEGWSSEPTTTTTTTTDGDPTPDSDWAGVDPHDEHAPDARGSRGNAAQGNRPSAKDPSDLCPKGWQKRGFC